jgi:hypothetical protein
MSSIDNAHRQTLLLDLGSIDPPEFENASAQQSFTRTNEERSRDIYFARRLHTSDAQGSRWVEEEELLTIHGSVIILGEPGMGKSEMMRDLGHRLGTKPVTAVRFMLSKDPAAFVSPGKPLLIDGLDEALARREGDAVDTVLAQLEQAGSPPFILSCRVREWQTRTSTNLALLYGGEPAVFALEPLTRAEAATFLVQRYARANAANA